MEVYNKDFHPFEVNKLKVQLWDSLPASFNLKTIDRRFIKKGSWITALGIWYIDPNSKYLKWVERGILFIKEEIKKGELKGNVTSEMIEQELNISSREASIVLRQIYDLGGFFGSGGAPRNANLGMAYAGFYQNSEAYDEFLKFNSLEEKLESFFCITHV